MVNDLFLVGNVVNTNTLEIKKKKYHLFFQVLPKTFRSKDHFEVQNVFFIFL